MLLADMERAGIAVSDALLEELNGTFASRASAAEEQAKAVVGSHIDGEELNLASVNSCRLYYSRNWGCQRPAK